MKALPVEITFDATSIVMVAWSSYLLFSQPRCSLSLLYSAFSLDAHITSLLHIPQCEVRGFLRWLNVYDRANR